MERIFPYVWLGLTMFVWFLERLRNKKTASGKRFDSASIPLYGPPLYCFFFMCKKTVNSINRNNNNNIMPPLFPCLAETISRAKVTPSPPAQRSPHQKVIKNTIKKKKSKQNNNNNIRETPVASVGLSNPVVRLGHFTVGGWKWKGGRKQNSRTFTSCNLKLSSAREKLTLIASFLRRHHHSLSLTQYQLNTVFGAHYHFTIIIYRCSSR